MFPVTVTTFTLYDCQSLIQLAAAINLGLTVTGALRRPYLNAFYEKVRHAEDRIATLKTMTAGYLKRPNPDDRVQAADATVHTTEAEVRRLTAELQSENEKWSAGDDKLFAFAVLASLASIILLFMAAGPHKTMEVADAAHLARFNAAHHLAYRLSMIGCAVLYVPLAVALGRYTWSRLGIYRFQVEIGREIAEANREVHSLAG